MRWRRGGGEGHDCGSCSWVMEIRLVRRARRGEERMGSLEIYNNIQQGYIHNIYFFKMMGVQRKMGGRGAFRSSLHLANAFFGTQLRGWGQPSGEGVDLG